MIKIKKVKLIAETSEGEEVILMDSVYDNAEISCQRGFEEPKIRETLNGVAIFRIPTKTYHILIRETPITNLSIPRVQQKLEDNEQRTTNKKSTRNIG